MLTLVDRFRNATIAGFNDRALYYHCASLSRQRKATERSENASPTDHTSPCLPEVYRMPITDTSVFRTRSAAVVLATVLANDCYKEHSSVYLVIIYVILRHSTYFMLV